jgi:hypothetical protein
VPARRRVVVAVLRTLWVQEDNQWRILAYDIETP